MRPWRGWRQNLGLKILAVVLSGLLWSYVHGAKVVEREMVVPLRLVHLPESVLVLEDLPRQARIVVEGPAQELFLRRFLPDAELRLDVSRARPPGLRIVPSAADVTLGGRQRLRVLRVLDPTLLEIPLDRRAERTLPVRVDVQGEPETGWMLAAPLRAEPAEVRCTGPAGRLEALRSVPTRPVDLQGARGRLVRRAALDGGSPRVVCTPTEVEVVGDVVRAKQRTFADRPVVVRLAASGLAVDVRPARVTVTLSGPESAVDGLEARDVVVRAEASDLGPGERRRVELVAALPAWARLLTLEPPRVEVAVRRRSR